jgi:hypothetical protein
MLLNQPLARSAEAETRAVDQQVNGPLELEQGLGTSRVSVRRLRIE